MTALLAAGGGPSLALQIPNVVEQAGSLAGFASVIGLAILSALYFSQARDLRRLREWAGRAPERAAEMASSGQAPPAPVPGRVVAQPQRTPQAVQKAPAPAAAAGAAAAAQAGAPAQANGDAAPAVAAGGEKDKDGAPVGAEAGAAAESEQGAGDQSQPKPEGGPATADKPAEGAPAAGDKAADGEQAGDAGPAKPGMPAPASAAAAAATGAAAGAAAAGPQASAAPGAAPPAPGGPASPGQRPSGQPGAPGPAKGGPGAQPQRPPGSVLPPRTGTMPPVRRLPSAGPGRPGAPQTGVPSATPPPEKEKRNPVYVALAIIGVLLVGGAAAVAVPAIVDGAKEDDEPKTAATKTTKRTTKPVTADKITVAVLNGTGIPGLAAQIGDRVDAEGFTLGTVSNASQTQGQRANSVAMYSRGHERDARSVARKLRIDNVQPVDADSQSIAGDASVVVIVGADKTQ